MLTDFVQVEIFAQSTSRGCVGFSEMAVFGCEDFTARGAASRSCIECLPGQFSADGAVECTDCPVGQSSSSSGLSSCENCTAGRFARSAGAAECLDRSVVVRRTGSFSERIRVRCMPCGKSRTRAVAAHTPVFVWSARRDRSQTSLLFNRSSTSLLFTLRLTVQSALTFIPKLQ